MSITLKAGDICEYSFGEENASRTIVQIVRILENPRGHEPGSIAEIRVLEVKNDASGNDRFHFLQKSGYTMNASIKYLRKI